MADSKGIAVVLISGGMDSALCSGIAEKEGYEMNAYFSYSLKNNVESVIPSYIELAVQDNGITAIQLANATVTGGVGAVADENLLQNVQLSEYKKTKQRDQDVKKQAALKKTANHK